ncbi:transporter [Falsihalocynthiibacter sp. S25ZX9]
MFRGVLTDKFNKRRMRSLTAVWLGVFALATPVSAQNSDSVDLAKKMSNPISSLISVPFQYNSNSGYGPNEGTQNYVNIQPVIPFSLNDDWNVISRTILPVISNNGNMPGGSAFGLGDTVQSVFFSPKAPTSGGLIWGAGPVFLLPTATEESLGTGKWGAGVTAVALKQSGAWTVGGLGNHIWSVAGDSDRADVNSTFLQPFVSYTTKKATSFSLNTESTYDWETEQWSVPINLMVNQMIKLGKKQPAQIGLGVRYWAQAPDGGPEGWGLRLNFALLYPK